MARELGWSRKELLSKFSSKQLSEWQAHSHVEPLYRKRSCYLLGYICTILANAHTEEGESFELEDFIPEIREQQTQSQTADKLAEKARRLNKRLGGIEKD